MITTLFKAAYLVVGLLFLIRSLVVGLQMVRVANVLRFHNKTRNYLLGRSLLDLFSSLIFHPRHWWRWSVNDLMDAVEIDSYRRSLHAVWDEHKKRPKEDE